MRRLFVVMKDRESRLIIGQVYLLNSCILKLKYGFLVIIRWSYSCDLDRTYLWINCKWYRFWIDKHEIKLHMVVAKTVLRVHFASVLHDLVAHDVWVTKLNNSYQLHTEECQD